MHCPRTAITTSADAEAQLEPLSVDADSTSPIAISPTVTRRKRAGDSHAQRFVASQLRVPLTAAPAPIALIMHCMHIQRRV
jgi:hypothetical protein